MEARHTLAVRRRARAHAALALDRRNGSRGAARRQPRSGLALHLPDRPDLADPRRPDRVRRHQVPRRVRHDVGGLPDLSPRTADRRSSRCPVRCGGRRRNSGPRILVVARRGDARLPLRDVVDVPDRESARRAAAIRDRTRLDRGGRARRARRPRRPRGADRAADRPRARIPVRAVVERAGQTQTVRLVDR